jgi:hypothetical protein
MILQGKDTYIDILMVYLDLEITFILFMLMVEEKNQHVQHCIFVEHVIATKLKKNYKVLKFQGLTNASTWSNTLGIGHTKYVDIYILY